MSDKVSQLKEDVFQIYSKHQQHKRRPPEYSFELPNKRVGLDATIDNSIYLMSGILWNRKIQKQPAEVLYKKNCSKAFRNIHRKTPVLESLFDKVAGL